MAIGTTAAILGASAISAGTAIIGGKQQAKAAEKGAQAYQQATDRSAEVQERIFNQIWQGGENQRNLANQALTQLAASYGIRVPQSVVNTGQGQQVSRQTGGQTTGTRQMLGGDGLQRQLTLGADPNALGGQVQTTPLSGAQQATATGQAQQEGPDLSGFYESPDYQFRLQQGLRGGRNALASQGMLNSGSAVRALADYQGNMATGELNNWRSGLGTIAGLGSQAFSQGAQAGTNYANALTGLNMNNAAAQASSYQNRANANTNALGGVAGAGMWALGKFF